LSFAEFHLDSLGKRANFGWRATAKPAVAADAVGFGTIETAAIATGSPSRAASASENFAESNLTCADAAAAGSYGTD